MTVYIPHTPTLIPIHYIHPSHLTPSHPHILTSSHPHTQVTCNSDVADTLQVLRRGMEKKINLRRFDDGAVRTYMTDHIDILCLSSLHIFSLSHSHFLLPSLPPSLPPSQLGIALDETVTPADLGDLMWMFGCTRAVQVSTVLTNKTQP